MLAKLIKYDLKYLLKSVALFGGLLLICAILFNITGYHEIIEPGNDAWLGYNRPSMIILLHTIFYNAIFVVVIWLILNSIMRIWHRYRTSFFLDESYLTHTLPIKRSTLWIAKFLSTVITLLSVLAAIAFSFAVLSLSPNGKDLIASFGISPTNQTRSTSFPTSSHSSPNSFVLLCAASSASRSATALKIIVSAKVSFSAPLFTYFADSS